MRELQALNLNIDLLSSEEVDTLEAMMHERYEELEKLTGAYDVETGTSLKEKIDTSPVTTAILDDDK